MTAVNPVPAAEARPPHATIDGPAPRPRTRARRAAQSLCRVLRAAAGLAGLAAAPFYSTDRTERP